MTDWLPLIMIDSHQEERVLLVFVCVRRRRRFSFSSSSSFRLSAQTRQPAIDIYARWSQWRPHSERRLFNLRPPLRPAPPSSADMILRA